MKGIHFYRILGCIAIFAVPLHSQGIDQLLKKDFDRKSQLLIRNELRKSMGMQAESPEVRELVKILLPWAKMEDFSPQQFAKAVTYINESQKAGIRFEENEELLPFLANYKGSREEFLILSRFMKEAQNSRLPIEIRDELIVLGLDNQWEALTVLIAGRLLILSRNEEIDTSKYLTRILQTMPASFSRLRSQESERVIRSLTKDFKNPISVSSISLIQKDVSVLKSSRGFELTKSLAVESTSLDHLFEDFGELELRRRPPAFLDDGVSGESSPALESWRFLKSANLLQVVQEWLGTSYKYGGTSKAGVDCSGFVLNVLSDSRIGVPRNFIPRRASQQAKIGKKIEPKESELGDLIFFSASPNQSKITHVGIFMGKGKFSHASSTRGVVIQSTESRWWKDRIVTKRRIFERVE